MANTPESKPSDAERKDVTNNPPGERGGASPGPGEPSPGLKDKDAETSDSYGNTRDSGDPASR